MLIKLILIYLLVVTVVTFVVYGVDKYKAKSGSWRIAESTLLWLVVIGGGVGALAAMLAFRHKTQHKKFTIGVPAIMIIEFLLANMVIYMLAAR